MKTKNITKFVVAVALTLAVTFSTGLADEYFGSALAPSASASCIGGNNNGGGGGGC